MKRRTYSLLAARSTLRSASPVSTTARMHRSVFRISILDGHLKGTHSSRTLCSTPTAAQHVSQEQNENDQVKPGSSVRKVGTAEALAKSLVFGVFSVPLLSLGCMASLVSKAWGHKIVQYWSNINLKLFGISLEVEIRDLCSGMPDPLPTVPLAGLPEGPWILVCLNQTSLVETLLVKSFAIPRSTDGEQLRYMVEAMKRPFFIFANIEYLLIPLLGWYVWLQGAVLVVRQWKEQARGALDKAIAKVRAGECCYMSIEGRRSIDGSLSPYKKGCAIMAIATQANVVPLVLIGARDILPYGSWKVNSGKVKAILGHPIPTEGMTMEDRHMLTDKLRQIAEKVIAEETGKAHL